MRAFGGILRGRRLFKFLIQTAAKAARASAVCVNLKFYKFALASLLRYVRAEYTRRER